MIVKVRVGSFAASMSIAASLERSAGSRPVEAAGNVRTTGGVGFLSGPLNPKIAPTSATAFTGALVMAVTITDPTAPTTLSKMTAVETFPCSIGT